MGVFASYSPGQSSTESLSQMNQGVVVTGGGPNVATPPSAADTVTIINIGSGAVRATITPVPALAATFTGNRAILIPEGASYQESFTRNVIQDITFVGVDLPVAPGVATVDTLTANANVYQVAVKFLEA